MRAIKQPTKINTPEQRLDLYKEALKDYKEGISKSLRFGFCKYLLEVHGILTVNFQRILPELYEQKPNTDERFGSGRNRYYRYWFKLGYLPPRIECLEKAIKLTEKKIKLQNL